jgi:hypothetical protein
MALSNLAILAVINLFDVLLLPIFVDFSETSDVYVAKIQILDFLLRTESVCFLQIWLFL